jgi:tRNA threonylcarbamoyladenosine biosynthesis protein TsaE
MNDEIVTSSVDQTEQIAQKLVKTLDAGTVIALQGDLGAGKTVFVQGLAKALEITEPITSPTFVLLHSYSVTGKLKDKFTELHHLDLYRLESISDVIDIGIDELLSSSEDLVVIEWAEKVADLLPPNTVWLYFSFVDEKTRKIVIRSSHK